MFIIHDENVSGLVGRMNVPAKAVLAIKATEENKSLLTVEKINRWLLENGADRDAFVLGVGGGITTDISGFAASVYKRGIRFGFVPTTLLAQVDAAIGGKNGVNLDSYKNIIGVFRQPQMIYVCPEAIENLPLAQVLSGSAELLKSFLIHDGDGNYGKAVEWLKHIHNQGIANDAAVPAEDLAAAGDLIAAAADVKAAIVGRDPEEHGERKHLNLGHTFAHAIEKKSGESIPHGFAVSMGIILAARLSEALDMAGIGFASRLEEDFKDCGLPTESPYKIEELTDAMKKDKKAVGDAIHFVLPLAIGSVTTKMLTAEEVAELLKNH